MSSLFGEITPAMLLVMIPGLVEFAKKLGASGNVLVALSAVIGVILGTLWQAGEMYPNIYPWITAFIYGILLGLTATGYYDLGKKFLPGNTAKETGAARASDD